MSEEFEVAGPHDRSLEHAAEHGAEDRFSSLIAITTALLAVIGSMFAYMAGATQADASLYKNDAAIHKTEASDQWNFYQAKGNKQLIAQLGAQLAPADQREHFASEAERYNKEKDPIMKKAQDLEQEATVADEASEKSMHVHHRWAQATTLLQISIALSAIALLTRRKWMMFLVYGFSAIGAIIAATTLL